MTQLIINGTPYPETAQDDYICRIEERSEFVRTASGRLVELVGIRFVVIEYSFGLMQPEFLRNCLATLRSGLVLDVHYLSPDLSALASGSFICTQKPEPLFAFDLNGVGHFHKIAFRLEEVFGLA